MIRYRLTSAAQQDLMNIRRFTMEKWGAEQSKTYIHELKNTMELLAEMPSMGRNCDDSLGEGIYRFPLASHTLYYIESSVYGIIIIAVLHQSMVPEKHLLRSKNAFN